jgi:outer membrane receptor protein involved in Fe transport
VLTGAQDDLAKQFQDIQGVSGTLNWGIGDATLTSITSWRVVGQRSRGTDVDGSGADAIGVDRGKFQNDTWSQELQLTDRVLGDKLVYQVGAYGFKEKGHSKSQLSSFRGALTDAGFPLNASRAPNAAAKLGELNTLRSLLNALTGSTLITNTRGQTVGPLGPATTLDFRSLDETLSRGAALFAFVLGGQVATPEAIAEALRTSTPTRLRDNLFVANSILLDRFETVSYAAFGEVTYDFTDRLSLTAGARFTHERRFRQGKQLQLAAPDNFNADISGLPIDDRFDKWTSAFSSRIRPRTGSSSTARTIAASRAAASMRT